MGNVAGSSIQYSPREVLSDISMFKYEDLISDSKFLKSAICQSKAEGESVVVKIFAKRGISSTIYEVSKGIKHLASTFNLSSQPNLLPYQLFFERIDKRGEFYFLVRQHVRHNLADRLQTRPLLTHTEKLWLIYQLLRGVEQAHSRGIFHLDIKSENVLITSWGWLLLTDFATFKPRFIPDDDPGSFTFFFDADRRRCYLAPERFITQDTTTPSAKKDPTALPHLSDPTSKDSKHDLAAMDMFSIGCVIVELMIGDGRKTFQYGELLRYRDGSFSIDDRLGLIDDREVRVSRLHLYRRCYMLWL